MFYEYHKQLRYLKHPDPTQIYISSRNLRPIRRSNSIKFTRLLFLLVFFLSAIFTLEFKKLRFPVWCRLIICFSISVIYDDDLTAAFVATIQKVLNTKPPKTLYVVLEKRYVFTLEHMESVAPCYETFLTLLDKVKTGNAHSTWSVEQLPLDFPKYFTYDRVKQLVLWKISSQPNWDETVILKIVLFYNDFY